LQCCGSNVTGGTRGAHCRMVGAIALEAIVEDKAEDKAEAEHVTVALALA